MSNNSARESHPMREDHEPEPPLLDRISNQPPEIITEIFKRASGGSVVLPPRVHKGPWALGHVCSRWRKILWSSPSVWGNITIESHSTYWPRTSPKRERSIRDPLNYIISNTAFPLSLTIEDGNADNRLDIILPHVGRFRDLSLDYLPPEAFVSILNLPPHSFSLLETFSAMTFTRDAALMPTTSSLKTAPNLRSVKYRIMNDFYIPQCLFLPLENMTHISVQRMVVLPNVVRRILLSSPCLVECSFVIGADEMPTLRRREALPNLETLLLEAPRVIEWPVFLDSFVTPALRDLSILSPRLPLHPVNSLLVRSNCPLKHLSLVLSDHYVDSSDPGGVESLMSQVPSSIVSLNLSWTLSGLLFWRMQHGLLPKLETIRLHVDAEGLEAFVSLADSYSHKTGTKRSSLCTVELCCWVESDVITQYMEWAKSYRRITGLDMVVFDAATGIDIMCHPSAEDSDETGSENGYSGGE